MKAHTRRKIFGRESIIFYTPDGLDSYSFIEKELGINLQGENVCDQILQSLSESLIGDLFLLSKMDGITIPDIANLLEDGHVVFIATELGMEVKPSKTTAISHILLSTLKDPELCKKWMGI